VGEKRSPSRCRPPRRPEICAFLLGVIVLGALGACASSSPTAPAADGPGWLQALIAQIASEPVTHPPSSILRYRYQGAPVYFRPARCCDIFSDLYDQAGALLCHPDGGITGGGDRRCPDFFSARTDEQLIWQDPRQ
jgi:hypothetical protein